jgi:2-polyprenyl-6-methoxyphenol hydroxylase-like FAD-dependent oxidoreductase
MSKVVICGGGAIGLCSAIMLGRDGHNVTVLEGDDAAPPVAAMQGWDAWERRGVAQFRAPHIVHSRFRMISEEELPGLTDALLGAGGVWVDPLGALPPGITDTAPRPGDEALRVATGRRPIMEWTFAAMAEAAPNVTVRRSIKVRELVTGPSDLPGVPHVAGVRTTSGEEIRADLVIDAMGRRSPARDWIVNAGGRSPIEEAEDSNFTYFWRHFSGQHLPRRMAPSVTSMGLFSILTLEGDNDTWSVTVYTSSKSKVLRALRDPATFHRVVAASPRHAHWLDGEPITPVRLLAGVLDQYRRFTIDGQPVITGFAAVGDAWACTNPSGGRGLTLGLLQAQILRNVVRSHINDPGALSREYDAETERIVGPFYRNQLAADRARIAEMNALEEGSPVPASNPTIAKLIFAAAQDADAFRGVIEIAMCVSLPQEVISRPRIAAKLAELDGHPLPPDPNIIDRGRLASLLDG